MTAPDELQAEPAPLERGVALDGFKRVLRARRRETTLREDQMRECHLVRTNQRHDGPSRPPPPAHVTRLTMPVNPSLTSPQQAVTAVPFARPTRSTAGRYASAWRQRIPRTRGRHR